MAGPDDSFGDDVPEDENLDEYEEAYERHRVDLYEMMIAYADEHDLGDGFLAQIIADIGVSMRMVAYVAETEKPSVGGLRLDLDRFSRELGDAVREAKKGAAEFIEDARKAQAEEAEQVAAGEDSEGGEGGKTH
ncbi:hypothetical protein [Ancylobacter terrae]|uniref:hypothetical protein n=1 Tax=Ancylobacter sp. sgz301288 TaxID=3342077 RepID=UPI00385A10C4